jgi:serine protease DegQ
MRAFLSGHKYPALLTFLSIGILIAGVLLKPQKATTEVVVSESESRRIQQMAQKRSLEDMTAFFSRVAEEVGVHVVYVREANAAGIVWNHRAEIVTAGMESATSGSATVILPDGREASALLASPDTLLASVRITGNPGLTATRPARTGASSAGMWVLQVGRRPDGKLFFTPGMSRGVRPVTCSDIAHHEIDSSIDLTQAMAGSGLFDLDGRMLGVAVPCGGRMVILPASEMDGALHSGPNAARKIEKRWGMALRPLDDTARKYFRSEEGLLVSELDRNGAAARTGVEVGDIVLTVDGQAVASLEAFHKALSAETGAPQLTILRRGRKRVIPAASPQAPGQANTPRDDDMGVRFESPAPGRLIEDVVVDSVAHRAGLRNGDRLLEVNGAHARRVQDLSRLLRRRPGEAVYLLVNRGQRQVGILIP